MQVAIDTVRLVYVIVATLIFIALGWRSARWVTKWRSPAWLHLCAMFLVGSAAHVGFFNLGEGLQAPFFLNVIGAVCGAMFILRTPPEQVNDWRSQRGHPPDWDRLFDSSDQ